MLLNADVRRPRYVTKSEREGRREPDRGRGRQVCMKLNTDIKRPDCTSITKREREGRRERAGQTEGGETGMHEVEHRHKTA